MKNDNKEIKENALLITERLKSLTENELEFLLKGLNHPAEKGNDYANKLEIGNFIYYTKFLRRFIVFRTVLQGFQHMGW